MKALFFISIIFFSPFLLLNTPAFGQEDESAGQQEDKKCLQWRSKRSCEASKQIKKIVCNSDWGWPISGDKGKILSPVIPDDIPDNIPPSPPDCRIVTHSQCTKWTSESYCSEWVSANAVVVDSITIRDSSMRERIQSAEMKNIVAQELNRRLDNFGLGATIDNPILPSDITINPNGLITFHINITVEIVGIIYIDPVIAVGYDYFIDHGPRVRDIELPKGIGDNKYNLWVFNPELNDFTDSGVELVGGEKYTFETPVRKFSIRGIEVDAGLDPKDQRAFPTGLAFDRTGKVSMRMIPITVDTDKQ
ncbi:MAG: hypothetical protein D3911_01175 [Candidatus Electrothrix sp. AW3_4]|nr:hypothetical protein [Candidatus Electrothrix gigas]